MHDGAYQLAQSRQRLAGKTFPALAGFRDIPDAGEQAAAQWSTWSSDEIAMYSVLRQLQILTACDDRGFQTLKLCLERELAIFTLVGSAYVPLAPIRQQCSRWLIGSENQARADRWRGRSSASSCLEPRDQLRHMRLSKGYIFYANQNNSLT